MYLCLWDARRFIRFHPPSSWSRAMSEPFFRCGLTIISGLGRSVRVWHEAIIVLRVQRSQEAQPLIISEPRGCGDKVVSPSLGHLCPQSLPLLSCRCNNYRHKRDLESEWDSLLSYGQPNRDLMDDVGRWRSGSSAADSARKLRPLRRRRPLAFCGT